MTSTSSEDATLHRWKAELACSRFHDYTLDVALDRARRFSKVDRAARDAQGSLILFGETYDYCQGDRTLKVDVVGLDLRSPGYVVVWLVDAASYSTIQSDQLTKSAS